MTLTDEQQASIGPTVATALQEDVGNGDLTTKLIPENAMVGAQIVARESMLLAGAPWATEVFAQLDNAVLIDWYIYDGQSANDGDIVCKLVGPARSLLTGERSALNFLQTLSATATVTGAFVDAIGGTKARLLDTRKTIPGLRHAQKYAVTCGGGANHRIGLFDAVLIKENHIKSAGSIAAALKAAQQLDDSVLVEVEVEDHGELLEALDAGAARILLDNFSLDDLRQAVATNAGYGMVAAELEASGNITLETIRDVAETGVDYISTGALTKNIRAADLTMLFRID